MSNKGSKNIHQSSSLTKIEKKIKLLGKKNKIDVTRFLKIRLLSTIIIFLLSIFLLDNGVLIGPLYTIIYYYLFTKITIDNKIRERKIILERDAVHFFDVLLLSLETGRNIEEALKVTISNVNSNLSDYFKEALIEVELGKSLNEALSDMPLYIPSDDINNMILTLTGADIYGISILETLKGQLDYLKERKILEIKATISKIPIKVSVISVLFFIPLILLIILAPALINYLK